MLENYSLIKSASRRALEIAAFYCVFSVVLATKDALKYVMSGSYFLFLIVRGAVMHKRGLLGLVSSLSWVVTALVALNMGLAALGIFNVFALNFFMMNPTITMYTAVLVGFLGAWSLLGFVKHLFYCSGSCEC